MIREPARKPVDGEGTVVPGPGAGCSAGNRTGSMEIR